MKILPNKKNLFGLFLFLSLLLSLFAPLEALTADNIVFESIETERFGDDGVLVKWRTNIATKGILQLGVGSENFEHYIAESSSQRPSRWHEMKFSNLKADAVYYYQIEARTQGGSAKTYVRKFETADFDIIGQAPQIKNLEIFYISSTAVALRWNTDISATSYVEYGVGANYKKRTSGGKLTTKHLAIITKLAADSEYYIKIYALSKGKVKSSETYQTFRTRRAGQKNEGAILISNFRPSGPSDTLITADSITLDFESNNLANGLVKLSAPGLKQQKFSLPYNTKHHLYLQELAPGLCYEFDLSLTDIFRNRWTESRTICTLADSGKAAPNPLAIETAYDLESGKIFDQDSSLYDEDVMVLGLQYSHFSPISRVLKTSDSPRIYAIMGGQRQQIVSPSALSDYGLSFRPVETVAWPEIAKYPPVRLAKAAGKDKIYFLWRRGDGTIMKISLPSPTIFSSYPQNRWADVVKISEYDLAAYPEVKLVRATGSYDVYYLAGGQKHFVSQELFARNGFSNHDVLALNQMHLDALPAGEYYK